MKLFILFSLVLLAYAEVPDCPNGYLKFDHSEQHVVFPSDGNLQTFPDNYVCQLQILVPFGYFASLTVDVEPGNPAENAPVQVIDQTNQTENVFHAESEQFYLISKGGSINLSTGNSKTQFRVIINWEQYPPTSAIHYYNIRTTNMFDLYFDTPIVYSQSDSKIATYIAHTTDSKALQDLRGLIFFNGPDWNSTILGTGRQLLDRKTQFVTSTSSNMHFLTVLFLGKDGSTNTRFMIGLYETTKDFVELQTVIYPEDWTGELSMDASNGKSLIQTWAQGFQGHSMTHGVLNITGTGNLEVYANQSLPNLANPIVSYEHMSIHSIRRQVKNVALKYSEAQVKVRNATSNSPGGPSAYQMEEIAILTQNPVCYMEIMAIIWQRLNDSGKNWRHVDKSLTLLEYLIRRGHSQVIEMSRQNLYMIETLKDFEYEENRQDRGFDIRQKALNIASVLTDLENLKKRNRDNSGMERNGQRMEMVREYPDGLLPSDMIEEDMQLQLALALSREQCEKELEMSKSDEVRLQMAMENSKKSQPTIAHVDPPTLCSSSNLLGGLSDPWAFCSSATATSPTDVFMMNSGFETNFMEIPKLEIPKLDDFWNPPAPPALIEPPRSLNLIGDFMSTSPAKTPICTSSTITSNFLGENGKLVNLDDLMGTGSSSSSSGNPWSSCSHHISAPPPVPVNPFAPQRKMPTLNEMRAAQSPAHFTTNQSIDNRSIFENQQVDKSIDPFAGLFF